MNKSTAGFWLIIVGVVMVSIVVGQYVANMNKQKVPLSQSDYAEVGGVLAIIAGVALRWKALA